MSSSSPVPRTTSRDLRREDTRRRIYQAAMGTFRRDGFGAARIDDIAEAAGVSHGAFYFHFATKEDVLTQCLRASEARVAAVVEALAPEARLPAVLDAVSAAVAGEWEDDPRIFPDVAMIAFRYFGRAVPLAGEGDKGPARRPANLVSLALAPRIHVAIDRGELNPALPPELISDLFLVNVFAATLAWCSEPIAPLAIVLAGVTGIFLDGVRGARL
jgi:AcrR family transcriptional regulator